MKVLNLYAGLGGNRRLWDNVEVTAVEMQPDIAKFYGDHYPDDELIIGDAHKYLLDHYQEFDFIWSSVPCPSHSRARFWSAKGGKVAAVYPDMTLYEEILLLQHYFEGKWVVENVRPFYPPIVPPSVEIGRHLFWCNFPIYPIEPGDADIKNGNREEWQELHGIDITGYKFKDRTDKILRNCVNSQLGLHILNSSQTTSPETISQMALDISSEIASSVDLSHYT
jgi:DNA (cytosine-5)-methyltransferase 1